MNELVDVCFTQDGADQDGGFIGVRRQFIAGGSLENYGVMFFTGTTHTVGNVLNARDVQIVIPGLMTTFFNDNLLHNETEIHTTSSNTNGNRWRIDGQQLLSTTIFLPPTFGTSSPG